MDTVARVVCLASATIALVGAGVGISSRANQSDAAIPSNFASDANTESAPLAPAPVSSDYRPVNGHSSVPHIRVGRPMTYSPSSVDGSAPEMDPAPVGEDPPIVFEVSAPVAPPAVNAGTGDASELSDQEVFDQYISIMDANQSSNFRSEWVNLSPDEKAALLQKMREGMR